VSERKLPVAFAGGRYRQRPQATPLSVDPTLLERPLTAAAELKPAVARRLAAFGLVTVGDLLEHFPRRYADYRDRRNIGELKLGEEATIRGTVERVRGERTARRHVAIVRATLRDASGVVEATWFNQMYLTKVLAEGMTLSVRGTFKPQGRRPAFLVKSHEILDLEGEGGVHTEGLVPVYPAGEAVSARQLRTLLHALLPLARRLPDPLPGLLRAGERLPTRADALLAVHLPRSLEDAATARARLVLEELILLQLGLLRHKARERARAQAPALAPPGAAAQRFLAHLPFTLTDHQRQAIAEIEGDLQQTSPMRRLLQGDVGSGKTVVALYALLRAVENGLQGALMAPTETLAEQHAATAAQRFGGLVSAELLTASLGAADRRAALARIASGEARLVIGTHALIQSDVDFARLGVAVVDEQHRFGVAARDELARRATRDGHMPHLLYMTATPIPRTLALTVYGDLDVTVIAEMPAGRTPVQTRLVDEAHRGQGYDFVRKQLDKGRQVYVVCPAIEASDAIRAATTLAEAERLRKGEFASYSVGVLHGQLKAAERERTMAAFKAGDLQVLVATSLIEVGIDVPNATVMLVEGAERFGLAQLHQLRGRVGRGRARSFCLLFSEAEGGPALERLNALLETVDGFTLADRDLEIRGEGQLFGARQAGINDLKLARLARDREAVARARQIAAEILAADPTLARPAQRPLADAVRAAFGGEMAWLLKA
jgi:ATP-dependent DNA helicase RecG